MRLLLLLWLVPTLCCAEWKYTLSIGAIFRDEARFLKEWIAFHRLVGVQHFYLVNHLSEDHYEEVLAPYIEEGIVELTHATQEIGEALWSSIQLGSYRKIIKKAKSETKWLAVIDTDEFLFPLQEDDLATLLEQYEECAGVCVNWHNFGTAFVKKIGKEELMIEKLLLRGEWDLTDHAHFKTILRPDQVIGCVNPHRFLYAKGQCQVNENKEPFSGNFTPDVSAEKMRINHYWTRDEEYFYNKKIPSRVQRRGEQEIEDALERNARFNQVRDEAILRFVPALRERIVNPCSRMCGKSPLNERHFLS